MRRQSRLGAAIACLLLLGAASGTAQAQDEAARTPSKAERQAARDAYDKGTQAFEKGDYVNALDSFVKANALIPSVQAMYWIARSQDKLGNNGAAIEAYEAITARGDFSKLSEDKASTVRERLAALKAAVPAPVTPAPAAPAPEPAPQPAPTPVQETTPPPAPVTIVTPPAARADDEELLPQRNTAELGVMGGALFISPQHNLMQDEQRPHQEFDTPVWQVGLRAAFFPEKVVGVEAEWAHGFGKGKEDGDSAQFDVVRGHLIGQLPTNRFVPFALLGAGFLRVNHGEGSRLFPTRALGKDLDFLLEAGIGFKVMATKLLVPRLDLRLGMTQAEGGGFGDGVALHPEVLLGMSFTLGR